MGDIVVKNLDKMQHARVFIDGSSRAVSELSSMVIGRGVYHPGWRWSEHAGPQTGMESARHVGFIEAGP
jgi:hypothetical protein